tara:strand:- start:211 stop:699 length:489 start_codon:yes stop_codon:yes gene_type:complete
MNSNFLNDILINKDYCNNAVCPDNYISEITGNAKCKSSQCDFDDEQDLNTCCIKKCNNNFDCDDSTICRDYEDIKLCLKKCDVDSDCQNNLICKNTNGIKYCINKDTNKDTNKEKYSFLEKLYSRLERILSSNNMIIDSIILISISYFISKIIDIFNININF